MTSFSGRCDRGLEASCTESCRFGSFGCGFKPSCRKCCCVTSTDILKTSVNERACCSSKNTNLYAYNTGSLSVSSGGNITFDHIGESSVVTAPGLGGNDNSQTTVLLAGFYLILFTVKGRAVAGGLENNDTLVFQLLANGTPLQGSQYASNGNPSVPVDVNVNGNGIFFLPANTTIQLNNVTGAGSDSVTLSSIPTGAPGSPLIVNASLTIMRVC